MAKVIIPQSPVVFNPEDHTYYLPSEDRYLSGITDMLHRQLFLNEFDGIDETTLGNAAEYGNQLHEALDAFDSCFYNDGRQETIDYIDLCRQFNLSHELSEFTVSDGKNWASRIDKIYRESDSHFSIFDIKSYGAMTPDKLEKARWQVSIYAYLLECQCPKANISRLGVIHLRNKEKRDGTYDHISEVILLKRIPAEICKELLDCDLRGEQFVNPYCMPLEYSSQENRIRILLQEKASIEEQINDLKERMKNDMIRQGVKSWRTETMTVTLKKESQRTTFNATLFKKEHPDIDYGPYDKITTIAPSIVISL